MTAQGPFPARVMQDALTVDYVACVPQGLLNSHTESLRASLHLLTFIWQAREGWSTEFSASKIVLFFKGGVIMGT